jgi:hypothetical protein
MAPAARNERALTSLWLKPREGPMEQTDDLSVRDMSSGVT